MSNPVPLRLPGVQAIPKALADGTRAYYYRHRKTGIMLGSSADHIAVQQRFEALAGRVSTAAPAPVMRTRATGGKANPALYDPPGTLGWLIGQFCSDKDFFADKERADSTRLWYRRHLYAIREDHGNLPFRAISDVWVDRYKRETKNATSKATANARVSALRRLFVFAKKRGFHNGANPAEKPELYKLNERLTIWERDEEARFLSAVRVRKLGSPFGHGEKDKRKLEDPKRPTTEDRLPNALAIAMKLGIYTGQRIGDVLSMRGADVKYLDGRLWLYVVQQKRRGAVKVWIPAHRDLQSFLEAHGIPHETVYFVRSSAGQPYRYRNFVTLWDTWLSVAGISDRTRHDMRRTAVVRLAEAGCSNELIRQITGHSEKDIRTLINHYLGKQPTLALQAIELLETADANRAAGAFQAPLARRLGHVKQG